MDELQRQRIETLIRAVALGDERALSELYDTMGGKMLSVAFGVLFDRALAEDALQESLVKIVRKANQFRFGKNAYGWVLTIVRNTALNILKTRKRRGEVNIDAFFNLSGKEDESAKSDERLDVQNALMRLNELQRKAIFYKYYSEENVRETAKKLGISKSAAQRLIVSAEEALKKVLTE